MMQEQDEKEILREEREEMNYSDPAPKFARFVNYIVDWVAIGVIIRAVKFGLAYLTLGAKYREHIYYKVIDLEHLDLEVLQQNLYVSMVITFLYYLIFEGVTRGRTLGKIMTDTAAITQDGTPFTFSHAFTRTLCRFIPFEPLSALISYLPWHDSISKTAVVRKTW
ncbi:MAG TPA: RDD family protein [Niastella sp.]